MAADLAADFGAVFGAGLVAGFAVDLAVDFAVDLAVDLAVDFGAVLGAGLAATFLVAGFLVAVGALAVTVDLPLAAATTRRRGAAESAADTTTTMPSRLSVRTSARCWAAVTSASVTASRTAAAVTSPDTRPTLNSWSIEGCASTPAGSCRDGLDDTEYLSSEQFPGATKPALVKPEAVTPVCHAPGDGPIRGHGAAGRASRAALFCCCLYARTLPSDAVSTTSAIERNTPAPP